MNTTIRPTLRQRLSALLLATLFTAGIAGGVNRLATPDGSAAQMAATGASAPRS